MSCLLLTACGSSLKDHRRTMIRVVGAEGVAFTGSIGTLASSSTVSGVTPQDFALSPDNPIAGVIQKSTAGDLREMVVECWIASEEAYETARTSTEFGVASVSCNRPGG
jgi:hypothetical protein